MYKVGILDDDIGVRNAISALLNENHFLPIPMARISEFHEVQNSVGLDLVLIDFRLRGESGLDLTRDIRKSLNIPIIMISGHAESADITIGLRVGADDFVRKPFDPRELIARIDALLRRVHAKPAKLLANPCTDFFGDFTLDRERRTLLDGAKSAISLTKTEFDLLDYFVSNPNQIISRMELVCALGEDKAGYGDRSVDVLVMRLRRKIEINPAAPVHLQTRRGKGYFFYIAPGPQS